MEADFRSLLVGDPALVGLVAARVYPKTYAQATVDPAVRYTRITGGVGVHMRGSDGLFSATMQVDARALTEKEALAIQDAIIERLHCFRGVEGTTDFRLIVLDSGPRGAFDDTGPKSYFTTSMDFAVSYRAA